MEAKKIKETAIVVIKIIGIFLGCAIVVQLGIAFMWACYYAGIPM